MKVFLVFLGGGIGSILRYLLSVYLPSSERGFPWATLTANLFACLLLGLGTVLFTRGRLDDAQRLLLLTGVCGGFSTFSTFSGEIVLRLQAGEHWTAFTYVILSLVGGLAAFYFGMRIMEA